ncbi:hypothetical protein SSX86_016763 [Deinandra increscens subsp. villosa]|uniref:Protein CHUP1, chloroplastic n=1 Tax=Deinandra increscens subsp. villosa TaxID=3103831 RepID=A0AAP0CYL3_9ASTR
MVAGKVKLAIGLQKSPLNSKPEVQIRHHSSPSPATHASGGSGKVSQVFSRSFGAYFPRSSAQVQPRPPDVAELLHLVEELRERESRLRTELLEQKLLKESVAIVPILENEISRKDSEISRSAKMIECLESENERLRQDVEMLHLKLTQQKHEFERRMKDLEVQSVTSGSSQRFHQLVDTSGKSSMIKSLKRGNTIANAPISRNQNDNENKCYTESSSKESILVEIDNLPRLSRCDSLDMATDHSVIEIRSRVPRVPKPPPRPSSSSSSLSSSSSSSSLSSSAERALTEGQLSVSAPPPPPPPVAKLAPPPPPPPPPPAKTVKSAAPPPPPPPPKGLKQLLTKVKREPEVVEFYHSLMRRDSRRESCSGASSADVPSTANTRDMIGEIENRSTHLLAIKTDVETQGDFIRFLIKEVESASFTDIEDVVRFVKWLDDELSYLVDERAVLKHFEWPERKADALREAAFGYCDLKKLESEASSFRDDPRQPCGSARKKMQGLFEKIEHGVYNLSRMRESASTRYKVFQIPMCWMQETGFVAQIKLASVKLAMKYMRRVSAELETVSSLEEEELILQAVRFAFRVHQFAGGFDVETMRAFQELRDKVTTCHEQCQNQQPQKTLCRHEKDNGREFPSDQRIQTRRTMIISNTSFLKLNFPSPHLQTTPKSPPRFLPQFTVFASSKPSISMATSTAIQSSVPNSSLTLLFVEMGVGYDQHGQDVTKAAMKACRDAISSNSIPAFRRGSIPGISFDQMKLQIKLGVPRPLQPTLDIEKVKSVFPYGKIENVEVVDGGLICSSGVHVEEMGDKDDNCYIVNAAVYVGY